MVSRDEKLLNGGGLATVWKEIKDRDQIATEDIAELNDKVASLNTSLAGKADASTVSTLSTAVSANTTAISGLQEAEPVIVSLGKIGWSGASFDELFSGRPVFIKTYESISSIVSDNPVAAELIGGSTADGYAKFLVGSNTSETYTLEESGSYTFETDRYAFKSSLANYAKTADVTSLESAYKEADVDVLQKAKDYAAELRRYRLLVNLASGGTYTLYLRDILDGSVPTITPNQYGDGHIWDLINPYADNATNSLKSDVANSRMTFDVNGTGSSGIMYGTVDEVEVHDNVLTLTATGTAGELSTITLYSDGTYAEQVANIPASVSDIPVKVSELENDVPYLSDEPGGKEWRQSNITTNGIFYSAISNGSIWVAASHKGEGLWYSTDGMTWTQSNITSDSVKGIYSDGNIWVAGSYNYKGLWYSTDGMTWTQSNNTSGNFYGVHSNGSIWVAAGGDNTGLWYSTDGMTWTQSNITSGFFNFAQGNENIWIAGKVSGGLYYSTDGMTWTQSSITAGSFAFAHSDGSIWVTGGNALGLRYSTDGMTWTQSNITSGNFYGVHSNGSIWVAAGYSNKGFYYSTDGMTWTQSNITSVTTSAIYYDGTIWVAGSSNNKGLYYSTDGMTWTQSNITSGYFYSVYSDGNIWVAGGDRYSLPNDYIDRKELNAALNEALPDTGWKEISVLDDFQEMLSQLISGGALESCGIEFMTVIADVEGDNNRAKQFVKLPSVRFSQYDVDGTVYTSIYADGFLTIESTKIQSLTATIEFNTEGVLTKTVDCLTLDLYLGDDSSSELTNASIWYRLL